MRGFLHLSERKKTNLVRLAHFFERPADAHVTRQSLAAIGRPFKGGNGGGHGKPPGDCVSPSCFTPRRDRMVVPPTIEASKDRARGRRKQREIALIRRTEHRQPALASVSLQ